MMRLSAEVVASLEERPHTDDLDRLFALAGSVRPAVDPERLAIQEAELRRGRLAALDRQLDRWTGLDWAALAPDRTNERASEGDRRLITSEKARYDALMHERVGAAHDLEALMGPLRDGLKDAAAARDEALSGLISGWSPDLKRRLLGYAEERLAIMPEMMEADIRPGVWLAVFRAAKAEGARGLAGNFGGRRP